MESIDIAIVLASHVRGPLILICLFIIPPPLYPIVGVGPSIGTCVGKPHCSLRTRLRSCGDGAGGKADDAFEARSSRKM